MTVYVWSTLSVVQSLTFTSNDQLAFDTGGGALDLQVSIGPQVSSLAYGGKTAVLPTLALDADQDPTANPEFLFLDGSRLEIDGHSGATVVETLGPVASAYFAKEDPSTAPSIDQITGGPGGDAIHLGDGNDSADGGAGDDSILGASGDDTVLGGAGNDTFLGGDGDDVGGASVTLGQSSGHPYPYVGYDENTGRGSGDNGIDYINYNVAEYGANSINGNAGDDTLFAGFGGSTVYGGKGHDILVGGAGSDCLSGDIGDDVITDGSGNDTLLGGDGRDTLDAEVGDDSVNGNAGDDIIQAGSGASTLHGGQGGDEVNLGSNGRGCWAFGDLGDDVLYSYAGGNTLWGGDGNDFIDATATDSIQGGAGDDIIDRGAYVDGGEGDDQIWGGPSAQTIVGGPGDDTINETSGNPPLSLTDPSALDVVVGFETGHDKLYLPHAKPVSYQVAGVFADYAAAGAAASRIIAGATVSSVVVVAQVGHDLFVFVDVLGNGVFDNMDGAIKLAGVSLAGFASSDVV